MVGWLNASRYININDLEGKVEERKRDPLALPLPIST